eukprot:12430415-Karenia_brevis.AAC.1
MNLLTCSENVRCKSRSLEQDIREIEFAEYPEFPDFAGSTFVEDEIARFARLIIGETHRGELKKSAE